MILSDESSDDSFFPQLYPLFVIETLGRFPGLTGLFIASILSASLSTVSSGVNSITTVLFEDIYKRVVQKKTMTDLQQATISKILCKKPMKTLLNKIPMRRSDLAVFIGFFVVFLAYLASYLGDNIIVVTRIISHRSNH